MNEVTPSHAAARGRPMKIERADRQTAPLVEGRFYLVSTVRGSWFGKIADWPVIGPLHEDREIFNFPWVHYHVDGRFLPRRPEWKVVETFSRPLHVGSTNSSLPRPVLRPRKCIRAHVPYCISGAGTYRDTRPIEALRERYAGHQCKHGKGGWICPHRNAPLGSIAPAPDTIRDAAGPRIGLVITCPLHGLRIEAETGIVLPDRQTELTRP